MKKNMLNKVLIVAIMILFVIPTLSSAKMIPASIHKADEFREHELGGTDPAGRLFFRELGPVQESTLYADGSVIELQTEAVATLMSGSDPEDMTLDEFKTMVQSGREAMENDSNTIIVSGGSRSGLNMVYSGSGLPPGGDAAMDAVAAYIENTFDDPITVTISVSFADLPDGILGWTYSYYAGSVSWTNTRNGLINGMDHDDFIHDWLPSGSTIPVRYNYYSSTVTNEDRCFFTRANYRATIGTVSGLAAEMEFNTYR